MSERMTDDRLDQIENLMDRDFYMYDGHSRELMTALKTERSYAELCNDQLCDNEKHITELRSKVAELESWIEDEGGRSDTCTFHVLKKVCSYCRCKRYKESKS